MTESSPPTRVYLAGPEVFAPNPREIGAQKKHLCERYGFDGVYPIDADLDLAGLTKRDAGLLIGQTNEALIRSCAIVIANITPFRGPSADVGTVYEMGFAAGIGLMVCAYTNVAAPFAERTVDFLGAAKGPNDMSVEDFDLADNLMIESCLARTGGFLVVADVPASRQYTDLDAFEACLRALRMSERA